MLKLPNGEYPTKDYDGNPRPTSGNWDIGAFQYKSNTNSYVTINVKVYLEGTQSASSSFNRAVPLVSPYSKDISVNSIPENIFDWIYIELRTGKTSNTIVGKRSAFLRNDGKIIGLDGVSEVKLNNISSGKYYIVIKHRNHLSIMSSNPVTLTDNSDLYNFTSDESKAYGVDAMVKLDDGSYGMYTGDGDGNGIINILDYEKVSNFIFSVGYNAGDFDMNSIVNVMDYKLISVNLFKSSKVPN